MDMVLPRLGSGAMSHRCIAAPPREFPSDNLPVWRDGGNQLDAIQAVLPLPEFDPRLVGCLPMAQTDAEVLEFAHRICLGFVEVLSGERGSNQLVRCTSARVYGDLTRRAARIKHSKHDGQRGRARLERVLLQRPHAKAAEVFARMSHGPRTQAMAMRLELQRGRWVCVAFDAR